MDFSLMVDSMQENKSLIIDPKNRIAELAEVASGEGLRELLEKNCIVIFKRPANHGFDLQIFSKENIYLRFFHPLQAMLSSEFRFFSINGKRVHNQDFFYFETHRLENPPHGFEEVFPESVL